ncbi:MAG TPA: CPBP family intramembrane glutamic endopeptidase [Phycisphaerae bacterium]|nr:CPBP family intramembrane glutamic endopeptidase [Phycisphaerae bacterium]
MPPRKRTEWLQIGSGKTYAHRTHWPLQSLIFILPLLLFYQIATAIHPWAPAPDQTPPQLVAFVLLLKFFALFGAAGNILPPLAVIAILLGWHLARKDKWEFDPRLYLGMAGESLLWAIPIFVIGLALVRHTSMQAVAPPATPPSAALPWQTDIVLSVGAGIYEELLFRLIAITLLNILFIDIFEMKTSHAIPLILILSAVLFAGYHYLGSESFATGGFATFLFRTAMGIYLAGIFIYRGFGIAAGAHAAYDLIVVAASHLHH